MEIFVARQPVFDSRKKIFGYELLFRNGLENIFPDIDGDIASSAILSNIFFSFELKELLRNKPGLVNFTRKLIVQRIPLLFPVEHIIIEVLENIEPDDSVIDALKEIRAKGFRIALDDFVYHERFEPMMDLCRIIKFDIRATPLESLGEIVQDIKSRWKTVLLAEKVETHEEFREASEMGFTLFQGYFFSKPEVLSKKEISANKIAKIKLIHEISRTEIDLEKIEKLVKQDVSISYKLIKFINSAYFKRPNPISTLKDAIVFLGTSELKKFLNVVVTSDFCENKPDELIRQSIVRARMCEHLAGELSERYLAEELFTLGLFSLLDAMLDRSMEDIINQIRLPAKMKTALTGHDKDFNRILNTIQMFEQGNWESRLLNEIADKGIEDKLPGFYLDSLKMADSLLSASTSGKKN